MVGWFMRNFNLMGVIHVCFQGDPGVPGFKGEAGPKGEPVSLHMLSKMKKNHKGLYEYFE